MYYMVTYIWNHLNILILFHFLITIINFLAEFGSHYRLLMSILHGKWHLSFDFHCILNFFYYHWLLIFQFKIFKHQHYDYAERVNVELHSFHISWWFYLPQVRLYCFIGLGQIVGWGSANKLSETSTILMQSVNWQGLSLTSWSEDSLFGIIYCAHLLVNDNALNKLMKTTHYHHYQHYHYQWAEHG